MFKSLKVTNKMEEIEGSPKAVTLHLKIPHSGKDETFSCCSSYLVVSLASSPLKNKRNVFPLISDPGAYSISKLQNKPFIGRRRLKKKGSISMKKELFY